MSSKKVIAEQVLYKLAGGIPDTNFPIDQRDLFKALEQKINSYFLLRHFDKTLPTGGSAPEHTMIATYSGITVTSMATNKKSYSTLPVQPISLPVNAGIYLVYHADYPDMPFIPLLRGDTALLRTDSLLSDIMGQISYEPKNNIIIYNRDLTLIDMSEVTMELCVLDISLYAETDRLPIPPDYEDRIIQELIAEFSPVMAESGKVNVWTNVNQQQPLK